MYFALRISDATKMRGNITYEKIFYFVDRPYSSLGLFIKRPLQVRTLRQSPRAGEGRMPAVFAVVQSADRGESRKKIPTDK